VFTFAVSAVDSNPNYLLCCDARLKTLV